MTHVMIDLETMSSRNDAAIIQIGAYSFELEGDSRKLPPTYVKDLEHRVFLENVDLENCIDQGFHVSGNTVMWWLSQTSEARWDLTVPTPLPLAQVLQDFLEWLDVRTLARKDNLYIWSHATFDTPILQYAYSRLEKSIPWHYRNTRDVRTILALTERDFADKDSGVWPDKRGHDHNAAWDAWAQVCVVQQAYKQIHPS